MVKINKQDFFTLENLGYDLVFETKKVFSYWFWLDNWGNQVLKLLRLHRVFVPKDIQIYCPEKHSRIFDVMRSKQVFGIG